MHGVPGGEEAEFGHHLGVPAEFEVGVDPALQTGHPVLLQPEHLQLQHPAHGHIDQRGSLPDRQGLAQQGGGGGKVMGVVGAASRQGELLELLDVDLAGLDLEEIAAVLGDQDFLGVAHGVAVQGHRDLAAQLEDVGLEGGGRAARHVLPPDLLHQRGHGHHMVAL